jgi:hypothetical protein
MNKWIITLLLLTSSPAHADFLTGLVVGSAISYRPIAVANRSNSTIMTDSIESKLNSEQYNPTAKEIIIDVSGFNKLQLQSIFKAKGYSVNLKGDSLVFDWSKYYEAAQTNAKIRRSELEQFDEEYRHDSQEISALITKVWRYTRWFLGFAALIWLVVHGIEAYEIVKPIIDEAHSSFKKNMMDFKK